MNYYDHAASTPIYPEVLELMNESFRNDFANPNSQHSLGKKINQKIEEARAYFLELLKASKSYSFYFTSSATESNNTVINGFNFKKGDVLVYCKADHPSIVLPIENLAKEKELNLKTISIDKNGNIDLTNLEAIIGEDIKFVALTHVNHQSGVINDIVGISQLIKKHCNAHIHIDAVQSFSKIDLKLTELIDSVSITAHKIGGPKGIAGLYLKKFNKLKPLIVGGGQEDGFRASTQSYPLIVGFLEATKISLTNNNSQNLILVNQTIKDNLLKMNPLIKFPFKDSSPYILTFIFPKISSDILLRQLESRGFYCSSTSACSSKIKGFNPTLAALNIPEMNHKNVLRLSFNNTTNLSSISAFLSVFNEIWNEVKHLTK